MNTVQWRDLSEDSKLHLVKLFDSKICYQESSLFARDDKVSLTSEDFVGVLNEDDLVISHRILRTESIVSEEDFMHVRNRIASARQIKKQ